MGTGGQGTGDSSLLIGPGGETIHSPITMIDYLQGLSYEGAIGLD